MEGARYAPEDAGQGLAHPLSRVGRLPEKGLRVRVNGINRAAAAAVKLHHRAQGSREHFRVKGALQNAPPGVHASITVFIRNSFIFSPAAASYITPHILHSQTRALTGIISNGNAPDGGTPPIFPLKSPERRDKTIDKLPFQPI